jgi:hypothetical protein
MILRHHQAAPLPRYHHDGAARTARRIDRVREKHRQMTSPFLGVLYPRRLGVLGSSAPVVIQTFRKFDAPGLIKILVDRFGTRRALSAGDCVGLVEVQEAMGEISPRSLSQWRKLGHSWRGRRSRKDIFRPKKTTHTSLGKESESRFRNGTARISSNGENEYGSFQNRNPSSQ